MWPDMWVDTGYRPRPLQARLHRRLARFSVLVCHRRFGKTVLAVNELIDKALRERRERPRYAYVAPLYRQAKQVAWDYLKVYAGAIPGAAFHETELRADLPHGARIQLFGADNPDALRGVYLDGVVLDEYAYMAPRVWSEILRPALADRMGWAIFIGTPAGRNAFAELYENAAFGWRGADGARVRDADWYGVVRRASETGVLPAAELVQARREMSEDEYAQEFECSFEAAVPGAIYGVLLRQALEAGRIGRVPHDPASDVETWWDLGHSDATAIWFVQRMAGEIRAIDYYEADRQPLEHYARLLADKRAEARAAGREWVYGRHLWPHDGAARRLEGGGRSLAGMMAELGFDVGVQPRHALWAGIARARQTIPLCRFDEARCREGLEALRSYRKEEDEKRGAPWRRYFRETPRHDWASHAADAFRIGAMADDPHRARRRGPLPIPRNHVSRTVV